MFGFLSQISQRLRSLAVLLLVAGALPGCGAVVPPIEVMPNSCELAPPIQRFHTSLGLDPQMQMSLYLLEVWWEGIEATAAALFHTPEQSASDRREFFADHVFNDTPTLLVDEDAFALTPEFALSVASFALGAGQDETARRWLNRSSSDARVDDCLAAIGREQ